MYELAGRVCSPWCLGGDFNAVLHANERVSIAENRGPDRDFVNFVEEIALNDIGFWGPRFTWHRKNSQSRIDRILGSNDWLSAFPNVSITHLPWYKSDHRPLHMRLEGIQKRQYRNRPLRFIAPWTLREEFEEFVKNKWQHNLEWTERVERFTAECKIWNKRTFGHIEGRKQKLLRRLNGITKAESHHMVSRMSCRLFKVCYGTSLRTS